MHAVVSQKGERRVISQLLDVDVPIAFAARCIEIRKRETAGHEGDRLTQALRRFAQEALE